MLYIAIVEKDTEYAKRMQQMMTDLDAEFLLYDSYDSIDNIDRINILFANVNSKEDIDCVKQIYQKNPTIQIVFYSEKIECALDAYDVRHVYFILKDEMEIKIKPAIERSLNHLKTIVC